MRRMTRAECPATDAILAFMVVCSVVRWYIHARLGLRLAFITAEAVRKDQGFIRWSRLRTWQSW